MMTTNALKIVIVGAGNVGVALGAGLRRLGHQVLFAVRARRNADDIDLDQAAVGADLTILAVPFHAIDSVVPRLGLGRGDVVVDATNPFGRELPEGVSSAAALVREAAGPDVHIVKAFNVLGAEHMATAPLADGYRPVLPVAADHEPARALVAALATDMGFDVVPIAGLDNAGVLEAAARYWGLLAFNGGRGREMVLVAHQRP